LSRSTDLQYVRERVQWLKLRLHALDRRFRSCLRAISSLRSQITPLNPLNPPNPLNPLVDTCASTCIDDRQHVPDSVVILPVQNPRLNSATNQLLEIVGMACLNTHLGDLELDLTVYFTNNLQLPLILGMSSQRR
jgi:hypothetical protein